MAGKKEWLSKSEEQERAAGIREKQARGETLTREEAGFLGAVGSREATARARKEAERRGEEDEFEEKHRTKSWMAGEETRKPTVTEETRREIERIRAKQERRETLTRHEAGVLGGAERAKGAKE